MNPEVLKTLEHTCWAGGTITAIIAAWFKLRSVWLSKQADREALQEKYRVRWQQLRDKGYLELPERGVKWLLHKKSRLEEWSKVFMDKIGDLLDKLGVSKFEGYFNIGVICIPGAVSIWLLYGMVFGIPASVVALIIIGMFSSNWSLGGRTGRRIVMLLFVIYLFASSIIILQLALSLEIHWTSLVLLAILPLYALIVFSGIFFASLLEIFYANLLSDEGISSFGFAFTLSFFITAIALLIGSFAAPDAYIPQTVRMFLVNVLCDGVTLLLTYIILGRAVDRVVGKDNPREIKKKYPIPVAIALDIIAAAVLACLSLYLGLVGSENALSIKETLNVLIARAPSGAAYELGPYFWVMHTTFIPTVMYLTVIGLGYIGKLIVLPVFQVLKKGREMEKPHDLTAAVFGFVTVVFVALAKYLGK